MRFRGVYRDVYEELRKGRKISFGFSLLRAMVIESVWVAAVLALALALLDAGIQVGFWIKDTFSGKRKFNAGALSLPGVLPITVGYDCLSEIYSRHRRARFVLEAGL